MMYDFDTIVDRRGTNSVKWDVADSELPMWVADMDFRTAPAITESVLTKGLQGVFGYGVVPPQFGKAIAEWWLLRYGWPVHPGWVLFCEGVVPAVSSIIRTLTEPGDGILVQSPVYNCFYDSIRRCGRTVVTADLDYADGRFAINWTNLEAKLADERVKLLLLCNPQNPTGQIWSGYDLARIGSLAAARGIPVISDEIHCDITAPGLRYTPFAVASPASARSAITLVSPTKSFNIPGLRAAAAIVADPDLRARVAAGLHRDEITEPNSFAIEATIAAYTAGGEWLDQMRAYVWANRVRLETYIAQYLPQVKVISSQATYLAWIDCSAITADSAEFTRFLRARTGLILNPGIIYGDNAASFVRINLACPASRLEDGLRRFKQGVATWGARADQSAATAART